MKLTQRRQRLRELLAGDRCIAPASVFDPLSARAAATLEFELMMLAGSVASATVLGAPDLVVLTLTEFAEQIRRITRAADLPLLVDADHGYGNALNVMRCVEELETAGVAGLTVEDTSLPRPFDATGDTAISVEEACGKLRAAVAAPRSSYWAAPARCARKASMPASAGWRHMHVPESMLSSSPACRPGRSWKRSARP